MKTPFAAAILLVLLFSCGPSGVGRNEELEEQKQLWITQINETFSAYTQDTLELRRRLDHYVETGNKLGQVETYRILGVQARYASQFSAAIELHAAGLELAREISDTVNITILLNDLATDYRRIGDYNDAAPYSFLALQTAEQYRGPDTLRIQRNMASAYNGIGNVYLPMGKLDEALEVFEKALELDSRQNNDWGIAVNLSNIGSIHFGRGEYELAEDYYRRSMKHNEKANQLVGTALGHINLGELYQAQDRIDDALAEYLQAYDALKGSTDQLHWLDACFLIADIHLRQGSLAQAALYLDEGLRKAREINSLKHLSRAYELYSTYNYERGDFRRSVNDLRTMQAYNDTIRKNQEAERLLESKIQYEAERYSRQIEELDRENLKHEARNRMMRLLLFSLLVVLVGVLLLLSYKRRLERLQAVEVKKLEKMRSNFFTNITHELRTPITVINGLAGHLKRTVRNATESEAEDLDAICRQGANMIHLVNQLLDFSRSEAGVDKPRWRHGDIVEYLQTATDSYTQYARSRGIELFVYSEAQSLMTNFAPSHLGKVIDNLLSNALKHTPEGGRIIVHLRHDQTTRKYFIQVKDNGEGIAPDNLPHIFELHYTSGTGKQSIASSGIGLALAKQLIEETGGTISVESTFGKGAEFTVSLPVSDAPIREGERDVQDEKKRPVTPADILPECGGGDFMARPEADDGRKTILIVEDNRDVAHYISTVLGGEYSLLYAPNGNEGLRVAERYVPDLIITDVMMPEKDGYAFTADLRVSLAVSHIPVIMLTAKATDGDRIEGLRTGADAYLTKPFNEEELLVRIEKLLESRARLMELYSGTLLDEGRRETTGANNGTDPDMAFISRLSVAISGHLDHEAWFPDGLAVEMGLSRSQLYRKVKAMTGNTVSSFVMQMRMNKARQLLSESRCSVKDVAFTCGFSDLGYFSRSFKNAFGCTPSQFLKNSGQPPGEE